MCIHVTISKFILQKLGEKFGLEVSGLEQGRETGSHKYVNKPLGSIKDWEKS
jgi:hypothetical protein